MGDTDFPWYYIDDVTAYAYEDDNQGRPEATFESMYILNKR